MLEMFIPGTLMAVGPTSMIVIAVRWRKPPFFKEVRSRTPLKIYLLVIVIWESRRPSASTSISASSSGQEEQKVCLFHGAYSGSAFVLHAVLNGQ